jgi:hypothetical protein
VQLRLVDSVVLGVVLPDVGAVGDLAEDLAPVGLGRRVEDGVEGRLDAVAAVPGEQLAEPARTHEARGALGVEVGGEAVRHPGVAGHDPQRSLVGHAGIPQLDRWHRQALFEDGARVARHRAGHRTTDVVVVAERLHEGDDLAVVEHRHGDAQVGQVADAALGLVDVVVEEHVALAHLVEGKVACDRVHERRVRAPGQLAQLAVVDAGAEVVRVADHRAARLVRAMAVSTSISTLARVPWTISTRIGSTVLPSGVSRLPCSYAVGSPAGLTGQVGCRVRAGAAGRRRRCHGGVDHGAAHVRPPW